MPTFSNFDDLCVRRSHLRSIRQNEAARVKISEIKWPVLQPSISLIDFCKSRVPELAPSRHARNAINHVPDSLSPTFA